MDKFEFKLAVLGIVVFAIMVLTAIIGGYIYSRANSGDNNNTRRTQVTACAASNDPIGCLNAVRGK